MTKEVRSGEIGFSGPVRKNNFTAQQGRRRRAVGKMGWFCPRGSPSTPSGCIPVHQSAVFARFPAHSCTPRTPNYNFSPFSCIFVYAPYRPPRTLCGRCHFRGYTYRNLKYQTPDYQRITENNRGRCPPYLDTYRSRVGGRRGKKAAGHGVTKEVRSGKIGFSGTARKNNFLRAAGSPPRRKGSNAGMARGV